MTEDKNKQEKKTAPLKIQIGTRIAEEKKITFQINSSKPSAEFKANKKKS